MPLEGFEPTILESEGQQTYALDGTEIRSIRNRNLQYYLRNSLHHKVEFFKVREENEDDEETYGMWNATIFRPVLEEVRIITRRMIKQRRINWDVCKASMEEVTNA
jgi:adenylylsulfate kinase-like enzyme